jgi:hypothetical protein
LPLQSLYRLISGEWILLHFTKAFFSLKTPQRVPLLTGEFSFSLDQYPARHNGRIFTAHVT